jgi:sarcosine oxidase, subunit gamma
MPDLSLRRANSLSLLSQGAHRVAEGSLSILPDAAKLIFRGRPLALQAVGNAFGVVLPTEACRFVSVNQRTAYWLGPDEWMLQAVDENPAMLAGSLEKAAENHPHAIVDVSHRSDAFALSGSRSEYLLNHGCPLDLSIDAFPVGMCTRTIFAKAAILLSRPALQTFHIDVWRSFAPYVWQLLDESCREFT